MKRIILSRTDSIGDVVLTLPMAGVIKQHLPGVTILFLGRSYTQPVIEASAFVDEFINWDAIKDLDYREQIETFRRFRADAVIHVFQVSGITKLAKLSGIPLRIGTTHRFFTWWYCNRLIWFSRKRSNLHEAQLNLKLLKPLGIDVKLEREEIPEYYGLMPDARYGIRDTGNVTQDSEPVANNKLSDTADRESRIAHRGSKFNLILHPKSKGSAREWGLENFSRLIELLPKDRFRIFITGTGAEGELMKEFLGRHREEVTDMTGKFSLPEIIDFIRECDGMVAASTGPLHLAAAFGKVAVGIYAPMRPIFPIRWAPLGKKAAYLVLDKTCNDCRRSLDCHCMREIKAEKVIEKIMAIMCNDVQ
ncbi:MAG: glycosyltransferase family 9 protein [Bacteroidota bacterium]